MLKKRWSIILTLSLLLVIIMGAISGCGKESKPLPYNVAGVSEPIKDSFLNAEENRINMVYLNENYDPNDPDSEEYFRDPTLPTYRVILLTEQSQLEKAFESVPSIDLEQRMIAVILYSVFGGVRTSLEDIKVENGIIDFIFKYRLPSTGLVTEPYLVKYVLSMDRMDVADTNVTITKGS